MYGQLGTQGGPSCGKPLSALYACTWVSISSSEAPIKILVLDIETRPNLVWTWGLWNQNVGINQIVEPSSVICFAAKWHGARDTVFSRDIADAWEMLDDADAVVTWNGDKFDIPHLNREFLDAKLGLPSPYASIDLLKTARRKFKFQSNKLDYVAGQLLGEHKTHHTGFKLWLDCMEEDPKAWKLMEKYNRQDVVLTDRLYAKMLPWISSHPHSALYQGDTNGCPKCGSTKIQKRGFAYTTVSRFQQFQCMSCGGWFRSGKRDLGAEGR
jgi:hypothetical protein